jgi:nitroreductase
VSVQVNRSDWVQAAEELIRSRRTIHEFQPEPPPREIILHAIDLARWAPNHLLTEPWHFYLLGPATVEAIARLNAEIVAGNKGTEAGRAKLEKWRAIPGWIVVTCDSSEDPIRSREDYAACCCAVHNFSLYLSSVGIGVKWTTGEVTRDPNFYDLIWVNPELETVVALLWYGYPAEIPQTTRKPLSQILVELP